LQAARRSLQKEGKTVEAKKLFRGLGRETTRKQFGEMGQKIAIFKKWNSALSPKFALWQEKTTAMKEEKIQLVHPAGKKLPRIDKSKYDEMKKAIFASLKKGPLTHMELHQMVLDTFKKNKVKFEGAIEWYMEGVKLDLEASKQIKRLNEKPPYQWRLIKK